MTPKHTPGAEARRSSLALAARVKLVPFPNFRLGDGAVGSGFGRNDSNTVYGAACGSRFLFWAAFGAAVGMFRLRFRCAQSSLNMTKAKQVPIRLSRWGSFSQGRLSDRRPSALLGSASVGMTIVFLRLRAALLLLHEMKVGSSPALSRAFGMTRVAG